MLLLVPTTPNGFGGAGFSFFVLLQMYGVFLDVTDKGFSFFVLLLDFIDVMKHSLSCFSFFVLLPFLIASPISERSGF